MGEVELGGATIKTGDGLLLEGRTLVVVREDPAGVVPIRLSADLLSGRPGTPLGRRLAFPTTAAQAGGRLLVVESQLDRRRPRTPFTVSALRAPGA